MTTPRQETAEFWALPGFTAERREAAWDAVCGFALPISVPAEGNALMSLPRFMFVLFPLWIALALWTEEQGRFRRVLVSFGVLLAASSALFVEWVMAP
jgi:hypothetical protein